MSQPNPEFIERYQLEYEKNPQSRIFAPLAEAYRKMGLLDEAYRICSRGVQVHPTFAGGLVAFAKVLIDQKKPADALTQLEKAALHSPDNLLAHQLMGDTLLQLRRPKEALKAFKMVLFLSPNDERAKNAVRKWEFLSADEYDEELFKIKPIFRRDHDDDDAEPEPIQPIGEAAVRVPPRSLERAISLADAFTIRGEMDRALELLEQARKQLGPSPELVRRIDLIRARTQNFESAPPEPTTPAELSMDRAMDEAEEAMDRRRKTLELLLERIEVRRFAE